MRDVTTVLVAAGLVLAGIAGANATPTQAQQQAIRSSCQNDYRTYCASVPTGGPEALQCLQKNVGSLSPACQQAVKAASGGGSAATTTQSGDAAGSSGSTASSGGAAPQAAAPAGSGAAAKPPAVIVLEPGQEIALMRQACGQDYRNLCRGVRVIGGGALSCLVSQAPSLSSGCKKVLSKLGQQF